MKLTVFQKKVLKKLIPIIKRRETISYGDLSVLMGYKQRCPRYLAGVLGGISEYTWNELGIFLSVIVINAGEMAPSSGFINMVNSVLDSTIDGDFIGKHLKCVYAINHNDLDRLLMVSTR